MDIVWYTLFVLLSIALTIGVLALMGAFMRDALFTQAPFVPLPSAAVRQVLAHMDMTGKNVLYDLGCGDARLLIAATKQFPELTLIGYEKGVIPFMLAKFCTRAYKNISIRFADIRSAPIEKDALVFTYLFPELMDALLPNLQDKLAGTGVVYSVDFPFSKINATEEISLKRKPYQRAQRLLVYRV